MKIVCLGDSFTVGPMIDPRKRWTDLLQAGTSAEIINRGVSGDTSSGMLARLASDCISEKPSYALLIGGANDLICCGNADIVKNNFMAMIHHLFHYGIKPIIATPIPCVSEMIPPLWQDVCDFSTLNRRFEDLNDWSLGFSRAFLCGRMDLFTAMTEELRRSGAAERMYLDGLHLSEEGHGTVAGIMQRQLERILR